MYSEEMFMKWSSKTFKIAKGVHNTITMLERTRKCRATTMLVVFGAQKINTLSYKIQYIHYKKLFGAACAVCSLFKIRTENYDNQIFLCTVFMVLMLKMFSFNSNTKLDIYLMPKSIYCVKRLIAVKLAEIVIRLAVKKF